MFRFLKDKYCLLFFFLFLISIVPFFGKLFPFPEKNQISHELYKEELGHLNSIDKMIRYADSVYYSSSPQSMDTAAYVSIVSDLMRNRFFLSPLNYKFSDNWVAYLSGKLFWSHLSSIVIADDIIQHPRGLCSQQTIVFMEILRKKKISARSIGLGYKEGPGHFLCEVSYNGSWHLHDVSMEPAWTKIVSGHQSIDYYLTKKDSLFIAYESRIPKTTFDKILERVQYGDVNKIPAPNMRLFHKVSGIVTYLFPILFFFAFLRSYSRFKNAAHNTIKYSKIPESKNGPVPDLVKS